MAAFDITELVVSELYLVKPIAATGTGQQVVVRWNENDNGPFKQVDDTPANDVLLTEIPFTASARKGTTKLEGMWLTGGTSTYLTDGVREATYTLTVRGVLNAESNNPPTTSYSRNMRGHEADSLGVMGETWVVRNLKSVFDAQTTNETVTAGEALDATSAALGVSFHTDGKYYKYNSATYPNFQGVIEQTNSVGADESFTLVNLKGSSTLNTGLTAGALYYVADGGALTTTFASGVAFLGKAKNTTQLDHALQFNASAMSDAQVTAGTDTNPQLVSAKQLKDAVEEHETTPVETTASSLLLPYLSGAASQTNTCTSTNALFGHVSVPFKINVNHLTVRTAASGGTAGTFDIAIYSENGQTKLFETTTGTISTLANTAFKTTLGAEEELPAGNYYIAMVGNGSASRVFGAPGLDVIMSGVSGERVLSAISTVTAGTLPATFDPTTLTPSFDGAFYLRLDN